MTVLHLRPRALAAATAAALLLTPAALAAAGTAADWTAGKARLVSVSAAGRPLAGDSSSPPALSADARFAAFAAPGPVGTGGVVVYRRDRAARTTSIVSVGSPARSYAFSPSLSGDGNVVAWTLDSAAGPGSHLQVLVRDLVDGRTRVVSVSSSGEPANSDSAHPVVSGDGRYVTFTSYANNLVAGTKAVQNVYVHDLLRRTTQLVTAGYGGAQADGSSTSPAISWSGRFVAFTSTASDLTAGTAPDGTSVYVRDLSSGTTQLVSYGVGGAADANSWAPALSAGGRYVAFESAAGNLVANDTNLSMDVFVRDLESGALSRVSLTGSGRQRDQASFLGGLSAGGGTVAYTSSPPETGGAAEVFVHDAVAGTTVLASLDGSGRPSGGVVSPSLSSDGLHVGFWAQRDLVPRDTDGTGDAYVRDAAPPK